MYEVGMLKVSEAVKRFNQPFWHRSVLLIVYGSGRPRACLRIWSRETGSAVPSRVSLLISILRLNLVLTHGILPEFRGVVHVFTQTGQYVIGSVPSYCVTQLRTDGVNCRESADTGLVNLTR